MPWCPVCKDEFREGFTFCNECKVPLVDSLDDIIENENLGTSIENAENEFDEAAEASAEDLTGIFRETPPETEEEVYEKIVYGKSSNTYESKKTKFEDVKSSAYVFIILGIGGSVYNLIKDSAVFTRIIMGVIFGLMIIYGIYALRKSAALKSEADAEDKKTEKIKKWLLDNINKDEITASGDSVNDAEFYFNAISVIRSRITSSASIDVGEVDDNLLDQLIDEFYTEINEK